MNWPGATVRRRSMAGAPSPSSNSVCSIMTTASAPRGTMPPVAIVVAEPGDTSSAGAWPQTITSALSGRRRGAHVARARGVGGAQREAIDVGAVERRHVDRGNDVVREHATERVVKRTIVGRQWRQIDVPDKACARLVGGDHFEELVLSRGAADRSDEIALDRFWFETCGHGQGLTMTSVDAGYPSLSGAIKIQPLAWASAESGT